MNGLLAIAAERNRQQTLEGFTVEHDEVHDEHELALAAVCYATPPGLRVERADGVPVGWPWEAGWWKPNPADRARELAKAGALIAAEIDRLDRLADRAISAWDDDALCRATDAVKPLLNSERFHVGASEHGFLYAVWEDTGRDGDGRGIVAVPGHDQYATVADAAAAIPAIVAARVLNAAGVP